MRYKEEGEGSPIRTLVKLIKFYNTVRKSQPVTFIVLDLSLSL